MICPVHRLLPVWLALAVLPGVADAAESRARWLITTEAGYGYDDNVGRAERERDIADDNALRVSLSTLVRWRLNNGNALTLRAFVEAEEFRNVDGLSHVVSGGQAAFRWQFRRGFFSPLYQFSTTFRNDEYNVAQRDNVNFTSQFSASRRMTENLMMTAGMDYHERQSRGRVFDLERRRLFLNANYTTASGWDPYGTYSYTDGEVWSTAQDRFCNGLPAADIFPLIGNATAIEPDEAFNDAYCGNWVAYRLDARINMLAVGINKKLQRSLALDLSAARVEVDAVGNEYDVTRFVARLLMRF